MIVVDTSALIAIVQAEKDAARLRLVLENEPILAISAGTLSETLVIATMRGLIADAVELIESLALTVVPVTQSTAEQVRRAYGLWGKGVHPAALNFGDCFAYALAREHDCPLLFVGNDFAQTDVRPAI